MAIISIGKDIEDKTIGHVDILKWTEQTLI